MKGVPLFNGRYAKEVPFLSEIILKGMGLVLGAEPPCVNFIEHPPDNHMNVVSLA